MTPLLATPISGIRCQQLNALNTAYTRPFPPVVLIERLGSWILAAILLVGLSTLLVANASWMWAAKLLAALALMQTLVGIWVEGAALRLPAFFILIFRLLKGSI